MDGDAVPLHVLDLPQLYTKPSAKEILRALDHLAIKPRTFGNSAGSQSSAVHPNGVAQYLTTIISSALSWLESDEVREEIWDAASSRLCERSGRTAMPSISREFMIPVAGDTDFSVTLREPSLTSDNLGMKTWVSSYLLAKRLNTFLLPPSLLIPFNTDNIALRVLELGAGTGLVGISLASLLGRTASVHLTDLPEIVPNLAHNVSLNDEHLQYAGSSVTTGVLDWSVPAEPQKAESERYEIIVAADPLYSPEHPRWLVQTIKAWLSQSKEARVVLEMPLRDAYISQVNELKKRMANIGLKTLKEGEEIGHDDWEGKDGTPLEVRCWWSVWGWDLNS